MLGKHLQTAAAGSAGGNFLYQDDVFTTHLWDGHPTGGTQSIDCGIDLTEGGLVWAKGRDSSDNHYWVDSVRGKTGTYYDNLASNYTGTEVTNEVYGVTSFNNNGFTVSGSHARLNDGSKTYASWVFRKAEGFFDIVQYTGNSTNGHQIAHNLGSAPGCIMIKKLTAGSDWYVYHRSLGNGGALRLNDSGGEVTGVWNSTNPTSTHFTLSSHTEVNQSDHQYIAYIFAHQQNNFGADGNQHIIKCGSFSTDGSSRANVAIGWEPEFFLFKRVNGADQWMIMDASRGHTSGSYDFRLYADRQNTEGGVNGFGYPTTSGVSFLSSPVSDNSQIYPSSTYVYIAIRRLPKPPESGTDVFHASTAAYNTEYTTGFRPDLAWTKKYGGSGGSWYAGTRLTGNKFQYINRTDAENNSTGFPWNNPTGTFYPSEDTGPVTYTFKRAPGFMDIVAYLGTGSSSSHPHNLGVRPELKIIKRRDSTAGWLVHSHHAYGDRDGFLNLDNDGTNGFPNYWDQADTATTFSVRAGNSWLDASGGRYVCYLFATLPGISKVGTYTGTGNNVNVDCGFTAGARFVMIKRTNSNGDWFVFDTARGIVSGNDPYLRLNSDSAENSNSDNIDPLNAGFTVVAGAPSDLNASGGTYLFLAIA